MTVPNFPNVEHSFEISGQKSLNLIEFPFGDNYSLVARDQQNHIARSWDVNFDVLDETEASTVENFLDERGGDRAFMWSPNNSDVRHKYLCKEYTPPIPIGIDHFKMSAKFVEDFRP